MSRARRDRAVALEAIATRRGWTWAGSPATRLRGLLGRDGLEPDAAIVLWPCAAVHTFGMRFAIDVVFLDRRLRVCDVRQDLRPGRMAWHWRACAVIETGAGRAAALGLVAGESFDLHAF